jgi:TonB-linked SusC/RagA family outer membrane protein
MKTKVKGIFTLLLALVVHVTFAQDKMISGTVTDQDGLPLPGVNIITLGTTSGAQTDFDGIYTIQTEIGATLLFSYVGQKQVEKIVGTSATINVQMLEDAEALEEVVVTGVAGPTSRKKLSVTVNSVGAKELEASPVASAASILQGKVAGVTVTNLGQPGSGSSIQLRGATNLFGGQQPLILVDGVIVEGGIQDLNPGDIESFEIVKGASASALYGSRAGNGVIVVTSKRGKKGQGPQVTLRSDVGFSQLTNKIELSKSHQYDLAGDFNDHSGVYTAYDGVTYADDYNGVGSVGVLSGGRIESTDGYNDNPYGIYYDNQDLFYKTGYDQTLYASISNASENSNIFFSGERTENEGILKEVGGYERYGVRLNADFKINNWLKFSASNNYIRSNNQTPGGTLDDVLFNLVLQDPDVNLNAINPDGQPYYYLPNNWAQNVTNPLYPLWNNEEVQKRYRFLGGYNLNIKFTDWLNLDANYSIESTNTTLDDYNPITTYTTSSNTEYGFDYGGGDYLKSSSTTVSQKAQFTLNYAETFGDLNIKSKLSFLAEDSSYDYFRGRGNNLIYANVESLDNFSSGSIFVTSDSENQRATNAFAIVGLDYKDRYILDGMYRIDNSSLFGEDHRSNSYYRASGAYRISKDLEINGIQELKIHGAYGTAGQRPGFNWQYDQVEITEGAVLSTDRTKANPDLRPSTTTEIEVGLDADFLNRFTFQGVYSIAKTEDQFMLVDIFSPTNNGANNQWQNVGTVEFNTLELSLNAKIIQSEKVNWNLGLRFEKTTNEITELTVDPITVGPDDGELFRIQEGEEFGSMFGRDFVRTLDQMSSQLSDGESIADYVINRDGVVVRADAIGTANEAPTVLLDEDGNTAFTKIGAQTPDFRAGLTSNFDYKNLSFYMLWDWQQGGDIYNRQGQWLTRDNRNSLVDQANFDDSEKKHYDYYQALYDTNNDNAFWVEDATYVKLREASLFYTINSNQLDNVVNGFFKSIRLGVTGRNLLTLTDYSGWDPEVQRYDADTQNYYAVDFGVYPNPVSYTFSVQFKF